MSKESTSQLLSLLDHPDAESAAEVARIIEDGGLGACGAFAPFVSDIFEMIGEAARLTVETQDMIKASEAEDKGCIG